MYQRIFFIGLAFIAVGFTDAQRTTTTTKSPYKVKDVKLDDNYVNITMQLSRPQSDKQPSEPSVKEDLMEMMMMRRLNYTFRAYRLFPPAYTAFQYPRNTSGYKGLTVNPAYSVGFSIENPPSNATYVTTTTPTPENATTTEAPTTTTAMPNGAQQFPNSQRNESESQDNQGNAQNQQGGQGRVNGGQFNQQQGGRQNGQSNQNNQQGQVNSKQFNQQQGSQGGQQGQQQQGQVNSRPFNQQQSGQNGQTQQFFGNKGRQQGNQGQGHNQHFFGSQASQGQGRGQNGQSNQQKPQFLGNTRPQQGIPRHDHHFGTQHQQHHGGSVTSNQQGPQFSNGSKHQQGIKGNAHGQNVHSNNGREHIQGPPQIPPFNQHHPKPQVPNQYKPVAHDKPNYLPPQSRPHPTASPLSINTQFIHSQKGLGSPHPTPPHGLLLHQTSQPTPNPGKYHHELHPSYGYHAISHSVSTTTFHGSVTTTRTPTSFVYTEHPVPYSHLAKTKFQTVREANYKDTSGYHYSSGRGLLFNEGF